MQMRSSLPFFDIAKSGINSPFRWFKVELFAFLWTFPSVIIIAPIAAFFNQGGAENMFENIRPAALALACMLLPFATALYGLCRQIPRQHERHWQTIITPRERIDWRKMLVGGAVWGIILLADFAVSYFAEPERFRFAFQPLEWTLLLFVVVLFIPLQSGFEELAFRGYLMQTTGLVSKRVWQPLVLTSIAFGLLHGANPEVSAYGYVTMIGYIGTGLTLGVAAVMEDGIELAIGAHAANNILNALIITEPNSVFQTPSLFVMQSQQPSALWLTVETVVTGVLFLIVISKLYGWGSWKRLVAPIWDVEETISDETNTERGE
jgi:hypothetical protein